MSSTFVNIPAIGNQGPPGPAGSGGGGTPGGSDTQVQYNSSGSFAGSPNLTFDGSDLTIGAVGASFLTSQPSEYWGENVPGLFFDPTLAGSPAVYFIGTKDINDTTTNEVDLAIVTGAQTDTSTANPTGAVLITSGDNLATTAALSGSLFLGTGITSGSGATGEILFVTGNATGTGQSGHIYLQTGSSGVADVPSGNVFIQPGSSQTTSSAAGSFLFTGGPNTSSGEGGSFNVTTGSSSTGTSGSIALMTGTGTHRGTIQFRDGSEGTSGYVWTSKDTSGTGNWAAVSSGANTSLSNLISPTAINLSTLTFAVNGGINTPDAAPFNNSGGLAFQTGNASNGSTGNIAFTTGSVSNSQPTGYISFAVGTTQGNTNAQPQGISLISGQNLTSTAWGPITLNVGNNNTGLIQFQDGSEGTVGQVWTSTDTSGSGSWAPASGSGANTALSNLASVAINSDLLPASTETRSIGSPSLIWEDLYVDTINGNGTNLTLTSSTIIAVGAFRLNSATASPLIFRDAGSGFQDRLFMTSGAAAWDWHLPTAQGSAGTVLTNDGSGNLSWTGGNITQTLSAGDTLSSSNASLALQSASPVSTSTSTVIASGTTQGQALIVVNVGSNSITLKSGGNTDLPSLTDYVLTASSSISFIWMGSTWYCTGVSAN